MKKFIANLFVAVVITLSLSTFASAQIFDNIHIKSVINTAVPGKCMDVANGQTTNGTPIVQYDCHYATNQTFSVIYWNNGYIIQSKLDPRKCVGMNNNQFANAGELLRLVPCIGSTGDYQRGALWQLDTVNNKARFRAVLQSSNSLNTCIDIPSGSSSNSLWLQLYYCHNGGNQQWDFKADTVVIP